VLELREGKIREAEYEKAGVTCQETAKAMINDVGKS
jgi:hypothetical protein